MISAISLEKHPHARGEDFIKDGRELPGDETPPRTWGRPAFRKNFHSEERNTPTHVGKTGLFVRVLSKEEKHPHARGEDSSTAVSSTWPVETPPRTWGRLISCGVLSVTYGNTPTHVGKTRHGRKYHGRGEKHPHARGEDPGIWAWRTARRETPPRTWGRPDLLVKLKDLERNTPTHVGKTLSTPSGHTFRRKHPHARGEDTTEWPLRSIAFETPPRTWGRRSLLSCSSNRKGNTPTHVGKTGTGGAALLPLQKHPHARGEDPFPSQGRKGQAETPPRTWGRPVLVVPPFCLCGNTPTHVGKTPREPSRAGKNGKHPHARGEDGHAAHC